MEVFENKVLRRIYGCKDSNGRMEKITKRETFISRIPLNMISDQIEDDHMGEACSTQRWGYKIQNFIEKPEMKISLGGPRRRTEDIIKMYITDNM
jgi:hypothetical protein